MRSPQFLSELSRAVDSSQTGTSIAVYLKHVLQVFPGFEAEELPVDHITVLCRCGLAKETLNSNLRSGIIHGGRPIGLAISSGLRTENKEFLEAPGWQPEEPLILQIKCGAGLR